MLLGGANIEIGDYIRDDADDYEGQVVALDEGAGTVTLRLRALGETRVRPVAELHYSKWDAKYPASGKVAPEIAPTYFPPVS